MFRNPFCDPSSALHSLNSSRVRYITNAFRLTVTHHLLSYLRLPFRRYLYSRSNYTSGGPECLLLTQLYYSRAPRGERRPVPRYSLTLLRSFMVMATVRCPGTSVSLPTLDKLRFEL